MRMKKKKTKSTVAVGGLAYGGHDLNSGAEAIHVSSDAWPTIPGRAVSFVTKFNSGGPGRLCFRSPLSVDNQEVRGENWETRI